MEGDLVNFLLPPPTLVRGSIDEDISYDERNYQLAQAHKNSNSAGQPSAPPRPIPTVVEHQVLERWPTPSETVFRDAFFCALVP